MRGYRWSDKFGFGAPTVCLRRSRGGRPDLCTRRGALATRRGTWRDAPRGGAASTGRDARRLFYGMDAVNAQRTRPGDVPDRVTTKPGSRSVS